MVTRSFDTIDWLFQFIIVIRRIWLFFFIGIFIGLDGVVQIRKRSVRTLLKFDFGLFLRVSSLRSSLVIRSISLFIELVYANIDWIYQNNFIEIYCVVVLEIERVYCWVCKLYNRQETSFDKNFWKFCYEVDCFGWNGQFDLLHSNFVLNLCWNFLNEREERHHRRSFILKSVN